MPLERRGRVMVIVRRSGRERRGPFIFDRYPRACVSGTALPPSSFLEEDTRERPPPEIEKYLFLYIYIYATFSKIREYEREVRFSLRFVIYSWGTNECKGMIVLVRKLGYREDVKE